MVYIAIVHLIGERNLSGSRVSDLLVYSGFAISPMFLSLPIALIFMVLGVRPFLYLLVILGILLLIYFNIIHGVQDNYKIDYANALVISIEPIIYLFCMIGLVILLLIIF